MPEGQWTYSEQKPKPQNHFIVLLKAVYETTNCIYIYIYIYIYKLYIYFITSDVNYTVYLITCMFPMYNNTLLKLT